MLEQWLLDKVLLETTMITMVKRKSPMMEMANPTNPRALLPSLTIPDHRARTGGSCPKRSKLVESPATKCV